MKINLIIGGGQLGSRHLQGLLKSKQEQIIYILDPLYSSLEVAKDRANEIRHSHALSFISEWDKLPKEFDLVIVATGANVREKVVTQLLEGFTVGYLVLEKVLFQDIESYDKIALLLEKTNTPTWVNHSRRMLDHFQQIKKIIGESKEQMTFHVVGSNWGLACNAVHCIDLCYFLSDSALGKVDMDWIDPSVHKSKRLNCIEFTGTVKGRMKDDSSFMITSLDGEFSDDTIFVSTNSNRWIIQEGAQKIIHLSESNNFNEEINTFTTEFQSTLTTRLVNDIFEFGTCDLPSYNEACKSHVPFIEASLKKYTEITGIKTNICPIT